MTDRLLSAIGKVLGYIGPGLQLVAVIVCSLIMTAVLVGVTVRLLKVFSEKGHPRSWRLMLALRFLVGFRDENPSRFKRLVPVAGQNFIAMTGTAIGVWALIVVLSVMSGFELDLKNKIIRNNPHITVERCPEPTDEFDEAPACDKLIERVRKIPGVARAESFSHGEALIASQINMGPGTTIRGIDMGGDLERLWLTGSVSSGALRGLAHPELTVVDRELGFDVAPSSAQDRVAGSPGELDLKPVGTGGAGTRNRPGIILGSELALGLGVGEGDEVTVVVPDGDIGPTGVIPSTRTFRVVGTLKTGLYEYDLKTAFVLKQEGLKLFFNPGRERIAVQVSDMDRLDGIAAAVTAATADQGDARVRTVTQTNRSLFSALMIEKIAMFLVLGLVILVAAFNVFGSLLLITMEKTRDIAVLRSMGVTRNGIRAVYFQIGTVIGLTGTLSGLILGLATCYYIKAVGISLPSEYYIDRLPVNVAAMDVTVVAVAALAAALVATIYPTSAVASMSPAEGLRND